MAETFGRHHSRLGSILTVSATPKPRPLSGGKQNQISMMADSQTPTSAVGGTFPVAGTFLALPLLAITGCGGSP